GGLVQKREPRPTGDRAGELEPPAFTEAEGVQPRLLALRQARLVQCVASDGDAIRLRVSVTGFGCPLVGSCKRVLQDAETRDQPDLLKRARNPDARALPGRPARYVPAAD